MKNRNGNVFFSTDKYIIAGGVSFGVGETQVCPICNKTLSRWTSLRRHIEDKHTSGGSHVCPYCQHVYRTKNSLHNHLSVYHRGATTGRGRRPRSTNNNNNPDSGFVSLQAAAAINAVHQQAALNAAVVAAASSPANNNNNKVDGLSAVVDNVTAAAQIISESTDAQSSNLSRARQLILSRLNSNNEIDTRSFESLISGGESNLNSEVVLTPITHSSSPPRPHLLQAAISDD